MAFSVVFLGTDDFSLKCLNSLVQHSVRITDQEISKKKAPPLFEIRGVITQPVRRKGRGLSFLPSPVAEKAKTLSLPVLTPLNLKDPDFLAQVQNLKAKWAILLSYGRVLPPAFLNLFPKRALNFHASLLPRWRGAAPVQRAIMAGDPQTGLSLQVMVSGLDKGPVIGKRAFELTNKMDAHVVFNQMEPLMEELLTQDMLEYMKGQKKAKPQEESQATYAPKIEKQESQMIWSQPASRLFNQIRALVKGPQAYTFYKGKRIKIYQADLSPQQAGATQLARVGQVVHKDKESFKVACGEHSFLSILKLQPESKKMMSAGAYLRGYSLQVGDFFTNHP